MTVTDKSNVFGRTVQGGRPRRTSEFYEYRRFVRERATMARQRSSTQLVSPAVDFQRIWSDRDARGATREGISIWRPNPPPGYCSLGERTKQLPHSRLVLLMPGAGTAGSNQSSPFTLLLVALQVTASREASIRRETRWWCGTSTRRWLAQTASRS